VPLQISHAAFQQELGLAGEEAAACSRLAVDIADSARTEYLSQQRQQQATRRPLLAYSCGPFGASLGDGSGALPNPPTHGISHSILQLRGLESWH